jgi:O-antigen/teichoic acid export membrane protein
MAAAGEAAVATPAEPAEAVGEASRRRTRLVASAVGTSLFSKVATGSLQLGAIPFAARALGTEQFAAFVVVSAAAGWISMGSIGLGPGVTRGVAEAIAVKDNTKARQYIATGGVAVLGMVALLGMAVTGLVITGGVGGAFGVSFLDVRHEMEIAFAIIAVASLATLALGVVDSAQAGLVEHYIGNLWTALGVWVSFAAVIAAALGKPALIVLALAIAVPAVGAKVVNALAFFHRHSALTPRIRDVRLELLPGLLSTGFAFLLLQLGGYMSMQLTVVVVAARIGPPETAALGVLLQIAMLLGGLATMVTQPLWPALMQARASGDQKWTKRAYQGMLLGSLPLGVLGGIGLVVFAGPIGSILYGGRISIPTDLALAVGIFFPLAVWAHVHSYVMVGLGSPLAAGVVQVVESSVTIALALVLVPIMGVVGVGFALVIGVASTSAWYLPIVVSKRMGSVRWRVS